MRNVITDVEGVKVGHAADARLASGVTAVVFDRPATASCFIPGGAPGSHDTALLELENLVEQVDAVFLSGGSAFGISAGAGVQAALRERGRGFQVGPLRVPIVTGAILFDLLNGGDKNWGRYPPYRELAYDATMAAGPDVPLGSVGAGLGATTANVKGGLGSASAITSSGFTVGAIVAVNAIGMATIGDTPHFWAGALEVGNEYGGLGLTSPAGAGAIRMRVKGDQPATTIAVVATDATLTKAQAKRVAIMANGGLSQALRPTNAPFDGDTIFAAATGRKALTQRDVRDVTEIGMVAADCLARAVARGVYEATALPFPNAQRSYRDTYGPR
jgi:L-aminopeptidase/D-esterase-like protein